MKPEFSFALFHNLVKCLFAPRADSVTALPIASIGEVTSVYSDSKHSRENILWNSSD